MSSGFFGDPDNLEYIDAVDLVDHLEMLGYVSFPSHNVDEMIDHICSDSDNASYDHFMKILDGFRRNHPSEFEMQLVPRLLDFLKDHEYLSD